MPTIIMSRELIDRWTRMLRSTAPFNTSAASPHNPSSAVSTTIIAESNKEDTQAPFDLMELGFRLTVRNVRKYRTSHGPSRKVLAARHELPNSISGKIPYGPSRRLLGTRRQSAVRGTAACLGWRPRRLIFDILRPRAEAGIGLLTFRFRPNTPRFC
jgi:hypothetical protein